MCCCLGGLGRLGRRKEGLRLIECLEPACCWVGVGPGIGAEIYTVFEIGERLALKWME